MRQPQALVSSMPYRQLEIYRLRAADSQFQSMCDDYEDAAAALDAWRDRFLKLASEANGARVREYEEFLIELEAGITIKLDAARESNT